MHEKFITCNSFTIYNIKSISVLLFDYFFYAYAKGDIINFVQMRDVDQFYKYNRMQHTFKTESSSKMPNSVYSK